MNYHNNLLLLLVINTVFFISFLHSAAASDRDVVVLLRVKTSQLEDPLGALDDWLGTSPNAPCNWTGVTCGGGGGGVVALDLRSVGISGEFPADFCRISTLRSLDLSDNSLGGNISSDSISLCSHLLSLNLSSNYFVGGLPGFPAKFLNLTVLDFSFNNFSGEIPASFVNLRRLQFLSLGSNLLNESIPEFLSNLTELTQLVLAINPFRPSPLPANIGRLAKLEILMASMANLAGEIPESIGNLISIKIFDVSQNNLVGEIPKSIGGMKNAEQIELFQNFLSGEIPGAFSGLTSLLRFDASQNNLTGKIPQSLAALPLESFNLNDNLLEGEIPEILALNPKLYELKLFNNSLSGSLPESLGMNSDLEEIDVSGNNLEGPLPQNLCYRKNLRRLIIFGNRISGTIPDAYGICSTLSYLRIQNNELYGVVPDAFWALNLDHIEFTNNKLEGSIPPSVSNAKGLTQLLISGNNFSGNLPVEICHLTELRKIDLSGNHFSGELPNCINKLTKLLELHMRGNAFSGEIPASIAAWRELTQLDLSDNRLSGNIPPDLGALPVLTSLNLSNNMLSGVIPVELTKLKLNELDISNNRLQGRVPVAFDTKLFLPSLIGNAELCSMNLKQLRSCSRSKPTSLVVVGILSALALILVLSLVWLLIKNRKFISLGCRRKQPWKITSFQRIRFSEEEVLLSLIDQNLVGSGASGRVYRVRLKSGKIVAAKRLWEAQGVAESEFQSEMETLGRIRHVNIVRLLFSFVGDQCKVLVYDYMENGSLGDVLHGEKGGVLLDWPTRFAIVIGAAQGLAYLHHDCVPPIMHRDFKSNNILLDEELRPRVADFGLAKILKQDADEEDGDGMSRVAGSYGYIAPEYGYTMKVTEKSDVYSFGVVLLELVSGRKPNDASFHENKNIVRWVSEIASSTSSCREGDWDEILDSRMDASRVEYEQVEKVLNVALLCTAELPINRPSMRRVVELLKH